jgi:hypothetical protein
MLNRIRIRISIKTGSMSVCLAALALLFPVTFVYFGISRIHAIASNKDTQALNRVPAGISGMRRYYLTKESFRGGDENLLAANGAGACTLGYHMASIWELLDPSALRYNPNLGYGNDDSGMGPPSYTPGWIRTGNQMTNTAIIPGQANCGAWGGNDGYGTIVNMPSDWDDYNQQDIQFWDAAFRSCKKKTQAWCVSDEADRFGSCTAPKPILCNQVIYENNAGYPNHLQNYDCAPERLESGPEVVYSLNLHEGRTYTVTAEVIDLTGALDIFLLKKGSCTQGECYSQDSYGEQIFILEDLQPGKYFLVVDGFEGASENYRLSVTCDSESVYLPVLIRK